MMAKSNPSPPAKVRLTYRKVSVYDCRTFSWFQINERWQCKRISV